MSRIGFAVSFAIVLIAFAISFAIVVLPSVANAYNFGNNAGNVAQQVNRSLLTNSWHFLPLSTTREVNFTLSDQQMEMNVDRFSGRVEVVRVSITPRNLVFKFGEDTNSTVYIVMKNLSRSALPPASVFYRSGSRWKLAHIGTVEYYSFDGAQGFYFDRVHPYSLELHKTNCLAQEFSVLTHNLIGGAPTQVPRFADFSLIERNSTVPSGKFVVSWDYSNGFDGISYAEYDRHSNEWNHWRGVATGFSSPAGSYLASLTQRETKIKYVYDSRCS